MQNSKLKIDRIVFWEPSLSPHKIDLINEIKRIRPHYEVLYISAKGISEERKKLGWNESGYESCIVNPSPAWIENAFSLNAKETIHIFSGFKGGYTFKYALKMLKKYNRKFFILSEPRASEGFKGFLRFLDSLIFENWYKNHVSSVFAIGINGPLWFEKIGYNINKLKLFGYFVDNYRFKTIDYHASDKIKIGFLGRTVEEKGIFDFINVANLMPNLNFNVIGTSNNLENLIESNKNLKNLNFFGSVNIVEIPNILHGLDIVILPSHTTDDGWGMIISEALMSGCYVITTDKVGSSVLIFRNEIGVVTSIKNPHQMKSAIQSAIDHHFLSLPYREKRKTWALRNLGADNGAKYLLDVIENNVEYTFFDKNFEA